jgi:ornithine--oxo-acid transaminase
MQKFGFDRVATMMSGSEAIDAALKIARKWGYTVKGIPENEAWIVTCDQCYHGSTLATMPLATVVSKGTLPFQASVYDISVYCSDGLKLLLTVGAQILEDTCPTSGPLGHLAES